MRNRKAKDLTAGSGGGGGGATVGVPLRVPAGSTYEVPAGYQALFSIPIDAEGVLAVDGVMVEAQ